MAPIPRRGAAIVAKDTVPYVHFLAELPGGDLLVLEQPAYAWPPGRLVRRRAGTFEPLAELPGVTGPAALSLCGRSLLAGGPLWEGDHGSCVIVDLEGWQIRQTLPLTAPFVWLDERRFVAQTPRWAYSDPSVPLGPGAKRAVDPILAALWPAMLTADHAVVVVDLDQQTARPVLGGRRYDAEVAAVLSPDGSVLYTTTRYARISAVRLADGALLWQRPPVHLSDQGTVSTLLLDAGRGQLIAAGQGDPELRVLDAATGAVVHQEALRRRPGLGRFLRIETGIWLPDGRLALAHELGVLLIRADDGAWTAQRIGTRAIQALALVEGGARLVAGGAERNLRVWPL